MKNLTPFDHLILNVDQGFRTMFGLPLATERPNPAKKLEEPELTRTEQRLSTALMRGTHAGEVSVQALYQGQALTARSSVVRHSLQRAVREENDHLDWCRTRIKELDARTSLLTPLWYAGSFATGAFAGAMKEKWNLGFVAETERQAVKLLDELLERLPLNDAKSREIIAQMRADEKHHATTALKAGGAPLPSPVKLLMKQTVKLMAGIASRI
ncbi:MAG: 2-polyprenyl-3-methyl-6-methoxy-1,4-benzoquinone monooxygenase [Gammaproteobacteria bacterium]|nr:2-polyprenyl-3-methyl-6-methoxy-1,4-benzoquinone monooxygenase [Gammaproteobacteria bacterium]